MTLQTPPTTSIQVEEVDTGVVSYLNMYWSFGHHIRSAECCQLRTVGFLQCTPAAAAHSADFHKFPVAAHNLHMRLDIKETATYNLYS